jgi:hypothetical protein
MSKSDVRSLHHFLPTVICNLEANMKKILLIIILAFLACSCQEKLDKEVTSKHYYEGVLTKIHYEHAGNAQMLTGYILKTVTPVHFPGDEFLDKCIIDEIQINWLITERNIDHYVNKQVKLSGELFGEHSAYHCRKVLLNAKEVIESK